jgi:hypothetical protein
MLAATPAAAQDRPVTIALGKFVSEKTCTTYTLMWGRETLNASSSRAAVATPYAAAYAARDRLAFTRSWGMELVKDCQSDFPALRASIRDALAASGKLQITQALGPGALVLTGRLSNVGYADAQITRADMNDNRQSIVTSVQFSLEDRAGRTVFGNLLTKKMVLNAGLETAAGSFQSSETGRTVYTQLQREVALALARQISFRLAPLTVVDATDRKVKLNYGAAFLPLGSTVLVPADNGIRTIKAIVSSASGDTALAEVDGGGSFAGVVIGAKAQFVEADDPAANAPRWDRVELP